MLPALRTSWFLILVSIVIPAALQAHSEDQVQIAPPMRQIQSPPEDASPADLERTGDELRGHKEYLDAVDYYRAAQKKSPASASIPNKIGIALLMLQRYKEAGKSFEEAIKKEPKFAEASNNLGVIQYERKKYRAAIKQYKRALTLEPDSASFYSNLGAAYFARKEFEHASQAYARAVELDPTIFEHTSHTGIAAQMASPEDRAHYDYVVAKLYAKIGDRDHSLQFLRKAMEDGYKSVKDAFTDPEFADLRKDTRFAELMKDKPPVLPE
jgi:tetratricopeptide (TPR) repeat protein